MLVCDIIMFEDITFTVICLQQAMCSSVGERAVLNTKANFYGSKNVTEAFMPIMKPNGRSV